MPLQNVFRGLADSTRRDILKLLAEGEMTIAEVADRFDMTRTAVKKHLQVLEDGALITTRTEGRTRVSQLNPAALKQADDWMQFFETFWSDRLAALEDAVTNYGGVPMPDTLTKTVYLDAPPQLVWRFLTEKSLLGLWYNPARSDLSEGEDYELYVGEEDDRNIVWGRVLQANPPKELVCTFEVALFEGRETTLTWTLEPVAGGTRLHLRHEGIEAASGDAAARLLSALDRGWDTHFEAMRRSVQEEDAAA